MRMWKTEMRMRQSDKKRLRSSMNSAALVNIYCLVLLSSSQYWNVKNGLVLSILVPQYLWLKSFAISKYSE